MNEQIHEYILFTSLWYFYIIFVAQYIKSYFTLLVNCLLAACSRKEAQSAPSLSPKGPTAVIHAPLSFMCHGLIHTVTM